MTFVPPEEVDTKLDFDFSYKSHGVHIGEDTHAYPDYLGKVRAFHRYNVPVIDTLVESEAYLNWASATVHVCANPLKSALLYFVPSSVLTLKILWLVVQCDEPSRLTV